MLNYHQSVHKSVATKRRASFVRKKGEGPTEQIHRIVSNHSRFVYSRMHTTAVLWCWFTEGFLNTNLLTNHNQAPTWARARTQHICTISIESGSCVSLRLVFTFTFFWAKSVFSSCFFFFFSSIKWFSFFCCWLLSAVRREKKETKRVVSWRRRSCIQHRCFASHTLTYVWYWHTLTLSLNKIQH